MSDGVVSSNVVHGNLVQGTTVNIQQQTPIPRDLWGEPRHWTNHAERLDFAAAWMAEPNPAPLVVKGPKHAGKSTFAGVAACRNRVRFPHGVLHLLPRRHGVVGEITAALDRLGVSRVSDAPGASEQHYRSLLAELRLLVVIDEPRNKGEVERLCPEESQARCIVLTSTGLELDDEVELELPPLDAAHALELLERSKKLPAEVNQALVAAFGGFPGKLRRAGGIVRSGALSVERLVELTAAHADERLFLEAFDSISSGAKRLYRALCTLPDPGVDESLLHWLRRNAPEGEDPVAELQAHELLYELKPGIWGVQYRPEGTDIGGPND
ncbi:hypothetical protein AB0B28_20060 [Glycomyces sp. NPDC046736]|uniref:hypothetical protein n=1 Tax=Glycomyces sp. NPDC046736 TaxID=3155615 RepID=UPI0033CC9DAB